MPRIDNTVRDAAIYKAHKDGGDKACLMRLFNLSGVSIRHIVDKMRLKEYHAAQKQDALGRNKDDVRGAA